MCRCVDRFPFDSIAQLYECCINCRSCKFGTVSSHNWKMNPLRTDQPTKQFANMLQMWCETPTNLINNNWLWLIGVCARWRYTMFACLSQMPTMFFSLSPFAQYHLNTNRELCAVSNQMRQCCVCVSVYILYRDQCYSYWNDIYALYLTFDKFCNLLPELPECWHKTLKTINIWSALWPCVKHSGADALTNHLEFGRSRNQHKEPVWTY